ncbi:MAG: hypothetical protein IJM19_01250 [Ruminococcus sp.]|nr:hypothetical protein [Ruminococcus sp.]
MKKHMPLLCTFCAFFMIVLTACGSSGSQKSFRSPESAVEAGVKAFYTGDMEKVFSYIPPAVKDYLIDDMNLNEEKIIEKFEEKFYRSQKELFKNNKKCDISIRNSHEWDLSDLSEYNEKVYSEDYGNADTIYSFSIDLTLGDELDDKIRNDAYWFVVEYDGKFYPLYPYYIQK